MRHRRKRLSLLLCVLVFVLSGLCTPARAAQRTWAEISLFDEEQRLYGAAQSRQVIRMVLDGVELTGDVPAFLWGEKTMFPLRLVSEALGADVEWQSKARRAVVTGEDVELVFTMGSPVALVNGVEVALPDGVSPCLATAAGGERTMVPLRFLAESLDFEVNWEDATRTVYLTTAEDPEQPLSGFTVALDAGHGGEASGAIYEGVMEKDLTLPITLRAAELLREKGCNVILTRADDSYVTLYERAEIANAAGADIFVSIHANASDTNKDFQGTFTYHFPGSAKGEELARTLQSAVTGAAGSKDWGLLEDNFVVLRETGMPAALVETGFMTCHEELMRLCDPNYREKLALGVAAGVEEYLLSHARSILLTKSVPDLRELAGSD